MFDLPMQLTPNRLFVFEGLDDTGKSAQIDQFQQACFKPLEIDRPLYIPSPLITHQPSGTTSPLGQAVYKFTEDFDWSTAASALTRQLLHLAAHNEHYFTDILPALQDRAVFMDRCWWSTFAYGYRGDVRSMMSAEAFINLIQIPARGRVPDLVFLFTHQYGRKASVKRTGSDRLTFENYLWLHERYSDRVVTVPKAGIGDTTAFISGVLYDRGYAKVLKQQDKDKEK